MTIKVIGAGFGRTGTLSLKVALEKLGFDKTHHMMEVGKSRSQIDHWAAIAQKQPVDWDKVFEGFQATTDFPAHNQQVIERIPKEKLLVFQAKDGWEPLCEFLGIEVPPGPFPHVNDTAEMQKRIRIMKVLNWLPLALLAIVVGAIMI